MLGIIEGHLATYKKSTYWVPIDCWPNFIKLAKAEKPVVHLPDFLIFTEGLVGKITSLETSFLSKFPSTSGSTFARQI